MPTAAAQWVRMACSFTSISIHRRPGMTYDAIAEPRPIETLAAAIQRLRLAG